MTVIAIDGTFSSGKGTLGRRLSTQLNLPYLDTGKLYRATALAAINAGTSLDDALACAKLAAELALSDLDAPELKSGDVGAAASKIAVHPPVRAALLAFQKDFAAQSGGAILDGRDIGTVICPDADVKLYVDAEPNVRAARRFKELTGYGERTSEAKVLEQLIERDTRDSGRENAPLKAAEDAYLLDTTDLGIEQAVTAAMSIITAVMSVNPK